MRENAILDKCIEMYIGAALPTGVSNQLMDGWSEIDSQK